MEGIDITPEMVDRLYYLILSAQALFWVGFVGMAAGAVYFIIERDRLVGEHKTSATLAALIAFVAAVHYYFMKESVGLVGESDLSAEQGLANLLQFPTEIRYIDWLITTPLLLVKFPVLLGLGAGASGLFLRLVVADLVMIITGYFGESSINAAGGATMLGWVMFVISMAAWIYIIYTLVTEVAKRAENAPEPVKKALGTMNLFIIVGWAIYPLGYFITLLTTDPSVILGREIIYNIADLTNKVGFGLVTVAAARVMSEQEKKSGAMA
jgi:bacteriorhodopsin